MNVWLDDERYPKVGWYWAKTAMDAIGALSNGGVTKISLDHDLGPASAGTGYDVILWIEQEVVLDPSYIPPDIDIHTANPVAYRRMQAGVESIEKIIASREG